MIDVASLLDEWHGRLGDEIPAKPDRHAADLRAALIMEEATEAWEALADNENREHIAKELADIIYVVYGTARLYRIPLDAVVAEVHRSNMTKLKGHIEREPNGKIVKGENYEEPDLTCLLS